MLSHCLIFSILHHSKHNHTGSVQTFTAPLNTNYKLEVWGAQGSSWCGVPGGKGGYARGTYSINKEQNIYIAVGGHSSCWNGGGRNDNTFYTCIGGGGATSIQTSLISDAI